MKKFFANLKMSRKLLVAPSIVILLMLVFGIVAYTGMLGQKSAIDDLFNTRFKNYQDISRIVNRITTIHSNVYRAISWTQAGFDLKRIEALAYEQGEALKEMDAQMRQIATSGSLKKEEKDLYEASIQQLGEYQKLVSTVIQTVAADVATATTIMVPAENKFQGLNKELQGLWELENKLSKERYVFSTESFKKMLVGAILVLGIAVVLALILNFFMTRVIVTPVKKTIEVIENVAKGDLTKRLIVSSRDEIGEMSNHFNEFVEQLHKIVMHLAQSSRLVFSAAHNLQTSAEQMSSGSAEVAAQVNSVATASEEMSRTSAEIAQSCLKAADSSKEATETVNAGGAVINETVEVMGTIANRVKESAGLVEGLGKRSDQIGQIIELINDIADQTNLLALNAAIEAARAGEHGRGFAVVADEVRKLAERTTAATRDIEQTIQAMQSETKSVVVSMDESVEKVETGTDKANQSGEALQQILHQINMVGTQINQIAVAAEEETATTEEIAGNIRQISTITEDTSKRIHDNAGEITRLAALAEELEKMVGQFRLTETSDAPEDINAL
ncbi:MAG: Methyl-accepting chemotaxis protein PctC [Syntrophorhabdus sp. PtaU1.Bin058]|nr:MAG: Methyl-accepting chemotaxis protein PctC [Syntrophorhabdus sp. PtaU1.Bin058]